MDAGTPEALMGLRSVFPTLRRLPGFRPKPLRKAASCNDLHYSPTISEAQSASSSALTLVQCPDSPPPAPVTGTSSPIKTAAEHRAILYSSRPPMGETTAREDFARARSRKIKGRASEDISRGHTYREHYEGQGYYEAHERHPESYRGPVESYDYYTNYGRSGHLIPPSVPSSYSGSPPLSVETAVSLFDAPHSSRLSPDISWRFAKQGARLTCEAAKERDDPQFQRDTYIDGVSYFLRAMPTNLNERETEMLLRSAPWLAEHPRLERRVLIDQPSERGAPFLQQAVRRAIALGCVLLYYIGIFVAYAFQWAVQYDQEHKIMRWLFETGSQLANRLGRGFVGLSSQAAALTNGRSGQKIASFCLWVTMSLADGALEGLRDGLAKIDRTQSTAQGGLTSRWEIRNFR